MSKSILDIIFSRRSIRKYQDQPVSKEQLIQLLQAGMAAPSANNGRPWEFIVASQEEIMEELRAGLPYGKYNAPAAIAICYNPEIASSPSSERWWVQDCCAAQENMLIAAAGLGLGSVWIGVYPKPEVVSIVRRVLNIPASITPLALMYVGHPLESKPPRTQYEERRVHWEKY